jgi:NAD(P)-dependent dehydrogenase (short-subunit alcohol dehydrogenase family)
MPSKRDRRTVIVTGGTHGIGAAIAEAFHREGCRLVIGARRDNGFARQLARNA